MVESDSRLSAEEDRERASSYCSCSSSSKLSVDGDNAAGYGRRPFWLETAMAHTLDPWGTKGLAIHMRTTSISDDASEMQCDSHPRNKQHVAVYHRLSRAYQPSKQRSHEAPMMISSSRVFIAMLIRKLLVEKWYIFSHRVISLT